jgi:hypothetical protein
MTQQTFISPDTRSNLTESGNVHISDEKFPEIFTGGNFPEPFPMMFAHRFYLLIFCCIIYVSGKFPEIFITGSHAVCHWRR